MEERICCYHQRGKAPCKKICYQDTSYCITHQPLISMIGDNQRQQCPDCQQMIRVTSWNRHQRVCSKKVLKQPSYYQHNYNSFFIREEQQDPVDINIPHLISKINQLYEQYVIPTLGSNRRYGDLKEDITPSEKHRIQELLLFQQMMTHKILPCCSSNEDKTVILDLGSGKGSLSKYISQQNIPQDSIFICIEKSHYKHKCEKNSQSSHQSYRVQIDLRDVVFPELVHSLCCHNISHDLPLDTDSSSTSSSSSQIEVIGMGKHLCGNATDTAILGLSKFLTSSSSSLSSSISLRGICIALCCHSNCQWNSSLCIKWFQSLPLEQQISPCEWEYLRRWSGMFALNDKEIELDQNIRRNIDDYENVLMGDNTMDSMTYTERVQLGRMCKRLIDYGRVEYIRHELQMSATLVYYTDESITPENVALLAWRKEIHE